MAGDRSRTRTTRDRPGRRFRRVSAAAAISVLAVVLTGCGGGGGPNAGPTFRASQPTGEGRETGQDVKDFHAYLAAHDGTKDLTMIDLWSIRETADPGSNPYSKIVTGLDFHGKESLQGEAEAAALEKAERLAEAFAAWRTGLGQEHGTVRINGPIGRSVAERTW